MRNLFLIGFLLLVQSLAFAQSISDLQKKKADAAKEIEFTTRLLNEAQKNENASLGKLRLINNKLRNRNAIISSINTEINIYEGFIADNELGVEILKNDLVELKQEYAEIIKAAYKNKGSYDQFLFFLSAENFNQAYRRFLYYKRYTEFRQKQAKIIETVQQVLNQNIKKLEQQKRTKQSLIISAEKEKELLAQEQGQHSISLQKLQNEKRSLQKKLQQQRRIEQRLENEIEKIIEEEARKNKAEGGSGFALTPEQKLAGNNFEQNKRRLPWPVERGVIVEHFGVHQHAVLSNVQVQNNGINIATEIGAKVRAVFNGEVSRVFGISGGNTAVIIRHGIYLSVYSNLREVVVKKGDKVSTKQTIGTVFTDFDEGEKSILKFQIWKESTKLNPELWIGR
jgi:septal ring factor EnvC (AmiA/AmiB activator)